MNCKISSEQISTPKLLTLPVFSEKPQKTLTITTYLDANGHVAATSAARTSELQILSKSLMTSLFSPASVVAKPAWCGVEFGAHSYFYLDGGDSRKTTPTVLFRLESELLSYIQLQIPKDKTSANFLFTVNNKGITTSIKAMENYGKKIAQTLLKPSIKNYIFSIATQSNESGDYQLILCVEKENLDSAISDLPLFVTHANNQQVPKLGKPYSCKEERLVRAYITFTPKGRVNSVRLSSDLDANTALYILDSLKSWVNPVLFDSDCKIPVAVVSFKLLPGKRELTFVETHPISFEYPKLKEQGGFSKFGLAIDNFETVNFKYQINYDGKAEDLTIINETRPRFSRKVISMTEDSQFIPAKIEGMPVPCEMNEIIGLKIGEYWIDTDGLKW